MCLGPASAAWVSSLELLSLNPHQRGHEGGAAHAPYFGIARPLQGPGQAPGKGMHSIKIGCRQSATLSGGSWPGPRARHRPILQQPQHTQHTQWQQHPAKLPCRYGSLAAEHAPPVCGRTNRVAPPAAAAAAAVPAAAAAGGGGAGGWVVVPEPLPSASELPDEPPTRSELIDLTIAIGRAKTWQELRCAVVS